MFLSVLRMFAQFLIEQINEALLEVHSHIGKDLENK